MEVIVIDHPQSFNQADFPKLSIALGFFDGIHIGHQAVIQTARSKAEEFGLKSAVMTFDPHPSVVLGKRDENIRYITPLDDKIDIIRDTGVDYLFIIRFTKEFARLLPEQFVDQYLIALNAKHVVAGFDYTYGHYGEGTMETLESHSKGQFFITVVSKQTLEDEKISSTRIRSILKMGDFTGFYHLTGRYYLSQGIVIHGEKRGRKLGFPTANLRIDDEYIFPATGVYAVRAKINETWFNGVCNVGYKPTFNEEKPEFPAVEVHILDFTGDLYGQKLQVAWHKRIRSEQKFSGLDALVQQIEADKEHAVNYFMLLNQ